MSEEIKKIPVNRVCVANAKFRVPNRLFCDSKIILDLDTYLFAGKIYEDVLIGEYKEGRYYISYAYREVDEDDPCEVLDSFEVFELSGPMGIPIPKDVDLKNLFKQGCLFKTEEGLSLSVVITSHKKEDIERLLKDNEDILEKTNKRKKSE